MSRICAGISVSIELIRASSWSSELLVGVLLDSCNADFGVAMLASRFRCLALIGVEPGPRSATSSNLCRDFGGIGGGESKEGWFAESFTYFLDREPKADS